MGTVMAKPRSGHPSVINEEMLHIVAQTSVLLREDPLNTSCDTYDYNNINKFVYGHFSFFYVRANRFDNF